MNRAKSFWSAVLLIAIAAPAQAQDSNVVLQYNSHLQVEGNSANLHRVQQGETLYSILRAHFGRDVDLSGLARETVALNPSAFRGGDMDRLYAGQTITLPHAVAAPSEPDDIYFF